MIVPLVPPPQQIEEAMFCWFGLSRYKRKRLSQLGYLEDYTYDGPCRNKPTVTVEQCREMPRRGPRWVCADCAAEMTVDKFYDPPDPEALP